MRGEEICYSYLGLQLSFSTEIFIPRKPKLLVCCLIIRGRAIRDETIIRYMAIRDILPNVVNATVMPDFTIV